MLNCLAFGNRATCSPHVEDMCCSAMNNQGPNIELLVAGRLLGVILFPTDANGRHVSIHVRNGNDSLGASEAPGVPLPAACSPVHDRGIGRSFRASLTLWGFRSSAAKDSFPIATDLGGCGVVR